MLRSKDCWTTEEVRGLIREEFGVEYSQEQVRRILRSFKMILTKPYPEDHRRPEDAEQILMGRIEEVFEGLKEKGIRKEDIGIGFIDEASPQNKANTVRVWSFEKVRVKKNTDKMKINGIGFYAIKGNDLIEFMENSKAVNIGNFLEKMREHNKEYEAIVVIVDNFKSHRSSEVCEKAKELGIYLVYLPEYSPDLNPIEQIWRVVKRAMSLVFVGVLEEARNIVKEKFYSVVSRLSFARAWITNFFNPVWNSYPFL